MAFTATFVKRIPLAVDTVALIYTWTTDTTGGEIDATAYLSAVDIALPIDESAAAAIRVQKDTSAAGKVTITTTSGDDGTILIIGQPAR